MADRWAVATGNWSSTATWNGGTLPAAGDDVFADGFTVTINQDVTVLSVRTTQRSGGTAGGGFTLAATWTLTADAIAGTTVCVTFNTASPNSATIVGNCTGGPSGSAHGALNNSTGTLTITGNCTGGSGGSAVGANNVSTGTMTITGNCTGGSGSNATGAINAVAGTLTITGNCTGGSNSSAYGANNVSTGPLTITGNCTGGSGSGAHGANNTSTGTLTITGNCTGGSGSNAYGANNSSTGTLTITGNCTGGSSADARGANNNSTGTLRLVRAIGNGFGNGSAGLSSSVGVASSQNGLTEVEEIEYGTLGQSPTSGPVSFKNVSTNKCLVYRPSLSKKTLVDSASVEDYPAVGNVRSGTSFNFGNDTGTLAVPNPNQVAVGVATDNTTGTAVLTAQNVRDAVGLASANLDTQLAGISVDLTPVLNRLPTSLVSGRMDASVGAMAANTVTASALAADAAGEVADAVWDEPYNQHTTAGSFGKLMDLLRKSNMVLEATVQASPTPTATTFNVTGLNYPTGAFEHAVLFFADDATLAEQNSPILTFTNNGNGTQTIVLEEARTAAPVAGDKVLIDATSHVHAIADIQSGLALQTTSLAIKAKTDLITTGTVFVTVDRVAGSTITMHYSESTTATVPLDEDTTSLTLRFVVENSDQLDVLVIENANITRTASNFTVTITTGVTATLGQYRWALRDITGGINRHIEGGVLQVISAANKDA